MVRMEPSILGLRTEEPKHGSRTWQDRSSTLAGSPSTILPPNPSSQEPMAGSSASLPIPRRLVFEDIGGTLKSAIDQNQVPAPDVTTEYILHFPQGISVQQGEELSCQVFCGYHSFFDYNGVQVKYAVIPYSSDCPGCGGTYERYAGTISHEIVETITDPLGKTLSSSSYRDQCEEEIGDICNGIIGMATGTDGNEYPVQLQWSNSRGECYAGQSSSDPSTAPTGVPTSKPTAKPSAMPTAMPTSAGQSTIMKKQSVESINEKKTNLRTKL